MLKKVWWVHLSHHLPLLVPRLSSWWRQGTPSSLPPSPPPYDNHFHFLSNLAQWLRSDLLVEHHRQFDFILKHSKHVGGAGWEGINVFWWQEFAIAGWTAKRWKIALKYAALTKPTFKSETDYLLKTRWNWTEQIEGGKIRWASRHAWIRGRFSWCTRGDFLNAYQGRSCWSQKVRTHSR